MNTPLLSAEITGFSFHGEDRPALRQLGISASPGTLTAVLGGSGSGKSTLGRLLGGWLRPGDAGVLTGRLSLAGSVLEFQGGSGDPRIDPAAWSRRVAYVPQDAASMLSTVTSTVAEELAFGLENIGMPRLGMLEEVQRCADVLGLTGMLERDPATLSGGELRRLALGCALITHPDVLILDEPLASLDAVGAAQLRELIRGLTAAGTAVVLLSQSADALARCADHWIVLQAGTVTAAGSPGELAASAQLAAAGVVVDPLPGSARPSRHTPFAKADGGIALLEVRGLSFSYPGTGAAAPAQLLAGLDLAVRAGETVAITGPNGAGKSTLLRHLNGLLRPAAGDVRIRGGSIAGIPAGALAAEIGLLFQHPRDQLFERTVLREVGFGLRKLVGRERAAERALQALAAVGLADSAAAHPAELPSSQQRLLALATVLAREPAVLALDEPTVGLDRHGLEALQGAAEAAAARGAAVLIVTHDLDYARRTAHRVLELRDGRLRDA
ncbi:energy-coupling factor transporter ATP-binding protein EcfA2 [Arthrobacter sp. B3I9]|uniref:ABC transporter ATP-binding protein n=1 Tax=Arthrobacter sp. B3I9 TaxID=3042270 RepID=UPI00278CF017|nr:ABC transporter ATP-binding protein [Arthrobacter sp. B3I9]MDQ0850734.1 energy-coupling factor transporter ATP-binding protein EcfA2 [Arthrobacter sp. B3I9]